MVAGQERHRLAKSFESADSIQRILSNDISQANGSYRPIITTQEHLS